MIKHINKENFENEIIDSGKTVLVDFFATWCGPCQMLAPVLEKVSESRAEFDIAKIDIDQNQELASKYEIDVVPTMVIFKNGIIVEKLVGYKNENEIISEISKYI